MPHATDIRPASSADHEAISATLARAFHDDPILTWLLPDPERRRQQLPPFFAQFVAAYRPLGETYVTDEVAGAALWAPPGVEPIPADRAEAFGAELANILGDDAEKGVALQAVMDEHHPDEPCFYLQWLAVTPEHQGEGFGSDLLASVLDRCDATSVPSYLEATSPGNRRLYERHGYETTGELTASGSPPLWPMWREPR